MKNTSYKLQPLNSRLIDSMAMRYRHDFFLLNVDFKRATISKMKDVYSLFNDGRSVEEVSLFTNIDRRIISQLKEEITGQGFYQHVS